MKKLTSLFFTVIISTACFAQKAEVKKNEIFIEGKAIAKIEKDGCGALSPTCNYYINNLNGEPLINIVELDMIDPMQSNVANPEGKVRFLRFSFTGINGVAEIRNPAMFNTRPKDVAQSVVKAKLITDGKLNEDAVINFIQANGARYTNRQKELNPQIVIIDNGK